MSIAINSKKYSDWLVKTVASGEKEIKTNNISPAFKDAKSAIKWLKS